MKISLNWLKEYIQINSSAEELAEMLTFCGLEVESVNDFESIKGGLKGLVIGEVLSCEKHPDADRLRLTTVNIGGAEPLPIVCGAPNVAVGQKVVVATVGAKLYPLQGEPFEIKKSKIRGAVSEGMICAEDEIGIGDSHDGIIVLPETAVSGTPASDYYDIVTDTVFDIGLTPNRVDAASHLGVARDIAALYYVKTGKEILVCKPQGSFINNVEKKHGIEVQIADEEICYRYSGLCMQQVKIGDSPDWLKHRLMAVGIKPINNLVDISNYVMMESGQPLHIFDLDKITGKKIEIKQASEGEEFTTLDGVLRKLKSGDLMIYNSSNPICMAGVYGGLHSGVTSETTSIFIESACFNAGLVRKTSKNHGLKTDASFRFERGSDAEATVHALQRAAELIAAIAGGSIASDFIDVYPKKLIPAEINFNLARFEALAGKKIANSTIAGILHHLEFTILDCNDEHLVLRPPLCKVDVKREADVAEEILRIYGYNNIETPEKFSFSPVFAQGSDMHILKSRLAVLLAGQGLLEIMNNSLVKIAFAEGTDASSGLSPVKLLNPLSADMGMMRQQMVHGMLEAMSYNINRKQINLRFFEFGKIYNRVEDAIHETEMLSIGICGDQYSEHWQVKSSKADFYMLKGAVEVLLKKTGAPHNFEPLAAHPILAEGASILLSGKSVGSIGKVKSHWLKTFGIQIPVYFAEISLNALLEHSKKVQIKYLEVPKFPEVRRDLSLILDEQVSFEQIKTKVYSCERKYLKDLHLFDYYQGKNIEQGKKSYALAFILQDAEATLNDKQIDKIMKKIIQTLTTELGAVLRSL